MWMLFWPLIKLDVCIDDHTLRSSGQAAVLAGRVESAYLDFQKEVVMPLLLEDAPHKLAVVGSDQGAVNALQGRLGIIDCGGAVRNLGVGFTGGEAARRRRRRQGTEEKAEEGNEKGAEGLPTPKTPRR